MKTRCRKGIPSFVALSLLVVCLFSALLLASDKIQWRQLGPGGGGNMLSVGVSPHDPNVVLMGSDVGGIFWTGDGGATWSLRNTAGNKPDHVAGYGIYGHFAFDPVDPNLVYIGAWRSTDRGYTWDVAINNNGFWGGSGVIDPNNRDTVYAWGYGNVFRTTDGWRSSACDGYPGPGGTCAPGGISCSPGAKCYQASCLPNATETVSAPGCMDYTTGHIQSVVIDPLNSAHLVACATEGLYESADSATTWSRLPAQGLPATCGGGTTPGVTCQSDVDCPGGGTCQKPACASLVLHSSTRKLFMVIKSQPFIIGSPGGNNQWVDVTNWRGGAYRSDDFGGHWTEINGPNGGTDALAAHNGSFEDPYVDPNTGQTDPTRAANWYGQPGVVSRVCVAPNAPPTDPDHPHSGLCTLKITDATPPNSNIAYGAQTPNPDDGSVPASMHVAVQGGRLYRLSAWYRDASVTGYVSYVKIGWYDAQKQPILWPGVTWNTVEPWAAFAPPWGGTFDWRRFESLVRPPDAARYAWIGVRGSAGTIWIDDVKLEEYTGLPRISGPGSYPYFASYSDIVVDPYDVNTIYTGTLRGTFSDVNNADAGGIWKTTDGGVTWSLTTRHQWHDNVLDNGSSAPICGDNVCGGRWETWQTCPEDCADGNESPNGHCGDNVCEDGLGGRPANGETKDNCPVDCPFDPDPAPRPYYENTTFWDPVTGHNYRAPRGNGYYNVWVIGIGKDQPVGSPVQGNKTLFFGQEKVKTNNGGDTWEDVSSNIYSDPQTEPGTLRARGETTDVWTYGVASDTRVTNRDWLFYGDEDNLLMASYSGGESFQLEGWQWAGYADDDPNTFSPLIYGGAATSFVLDPANLNRMYVAVSDLVNFNIPDCCIGGVVQGDFTAGTPTHPGSWNWTRLGDQTNFPKGFGGIELLRAVKPDSTIDFYASIFDKGVYKLANGVGAWGNTYTGSNWKANDGTTPLFPANWGVYRIAQAPGAGRLYVAVRGTNQTVRTSNQTGVWASDDSGATWVRISRHITETPGQCQDTNTDSNMDGEPVQDILPVGSNVVLAATYYSYSDRPGCGGMPVCPGSSGCVGTWAGDGGIYRGVRGSNGQWTWSRVLRQPNVTGLITSSLDDGIIYAFVGQTCCDTAPTGQYAGIYKSIDSGLTWSYVAPDAAKPLMNLSHGRLYRHGRNSLKIYASTIGDGVLEGTVTCTDPVRDFECAARVNASAETVPPIKGTIVSGSFADTMAGSPDDVYEVLKERTSGVKQLIHVWTLAPALANVAYELRVEAYRSNPSPDDSFSFYVATRTSGSCTGGETYSPTPLFTISDNTDGDTLYKSALPITANTVYCVRVADTSSTDSSPDSLSVDRVFLLPLPSCVDSDADGYTPTCSSSCYNAFCPLTDCNDGDAAVNPGQSEGPPGNPTCTDTKDNNCNGLTDASDPACAFLETLAVSDVTTSPGKIVSGSYLDTRTSNDVREGLQETKSGGISHLTQVWRFDGVPAGTQHTLHVEGYRTGTEDNFQFSYSPDNISYTPITGALITSGLPEPAGADYNFGAGTLSGTVYIKMTDTAAGSVLDTCYVDQLTIRTTP